MIKKIINYLHLFNGLSFETRKQKKFCIIENNLNNSLNDILKKKNPAFISIYKLNIFILINLIFEKKFNLTKEFSLNYYIESIKYFQCKVVFSMIDNNENILRIKSFLKNIKVVVVQNGTRYLKNDISNFKNTKKFNVDYYFTFNKYYSQLLSKYINAKFISIGSIENNKYKILKKKRKSILFISDFDKKDYLYSQKNYKNYNNYYKPEFKLLPLIENFCEKHDYDLNIAPRILDYKQEYFFYSKIFKNNKWKLLKKINNPFRYIDEAELIIFIHSTLGYEALFRNAKIAGLCCRLNIDKSRCFGWPKFDRKKKGFFWTNELNLTKCNKILVNLINMDKKKWSKKSNKYIKNFSVYNYNNIKLKKIISNL